MTGALMAEEPPNLRVPGAAPVAKFVFNHAEGPLWQLREASGTLNWIALRYRGHPPYFLLATQHQNGGVIPV